MRQAPMSVSNEHIALQRSGCGFDDSIAVEGSRIWGPKAEVTKFNGGEYRGYSHRGALHRTFDTDIKSCARCGGHVRVRAVVTDHETAARILDAIARRRARDPTSPRAA